MRTRPSPERTPAPAARASSHQSAELPTLARAGDALPSAGSAASTAKLGRVLGACHALARHEPTDLRQPPMPQTIGIDRRHWRNAARAAARAQRRRDELEIEALLDDAGVDDEDERAAISGSRCVECGTMLLVEAGYVPYSPAGVLVCAGCIEEAGGTSDGPGAIVRDWAGR